MDKKNVLITGSRGLIATSIINQLENYNIFGFDSLTPYSLDRDYMSDLYEKRKNSRKEINEVICDIDDYQSDIHFDLVIHTAAMPRNKEVNNNKEESERVMIDSLQKLLDRISFDKFVFFSSSMVYGDFTDLIEEDQELLPLSLYGLFKKKGEEIVIDFCHSNNKKYTIIRPSAVYGPLDVNDRLVMKFIHNAKNNIPLVVKGENEILDFTYVDDVGYYVNLIANSNVSDNKIYNLTNGVDLVTIKQLATLVINQFGGNYIIAERDMSFPSRGRLSNNKIRNDYNTNHHTKLEDGLKNIT